MKIICLVPSITETLLEAGIEVVGRTRFCIYPQEQIKNIPIVGGTKDIDWDTVAALKADLLVLDKEENPKFFAEKSPISYFALHVEDIPSCARELKKLSEALESKKINEYALRFQKLRPKKISLDNFVEWLQKPENPTPALEYIIWRNPIMAAGKNTFIGSVLEYLGHTLPHYNSKYSELPEPNKKTITYLFSSEPYPFIQHKNWIQSCDIPSGIVNGENFSWFGVRSLRFLEKVLQESDQQATSDPVDFYYDEEGRHIFTAHFLSKRGYCCKNGCRHCPYGFSSEMEN